MVWHMNNRNSEPSTASQGRVGAYLQTLCSDTDQSELARSKSTLATSCSPDSETDTCQSSQSGTTSARLTADRGEDALTFSAEAFLARILAVRGAGQGQSMVSDQFSGPSSSGSLAKWDGPTCSWRTAQNCLIAGLSTYLGPWPKWGIMQDGGFMAAPTLEACTSGTASGCLPTPCKGGQGGSHNGSRWNRMSEIIGRRAENYCPLLEMMMAWPVAWAEDKPLATDRIQEWRRQHSAFFHTAS